MVSVPDFLSIAVDPVRLAVLGAAAAGRVEVEHLAERLDVDTRRVRREVGRLVQAGLLTGDLELDIEELRRVAQSIPGETPADAEIIDGPWTSEEAEVLSRFFAGRRLTSLPSSHSKRLLVLERLAREFEPGLRYDEREVNLILQMFDADYATLRRYLVDEGFLTRADGVYWRTGGRVESQKEA